MKFKNQILAALLALSGLQVGNAQPVAASSAQQQQAGDWVDAEVRRVDVPGRKLTLRHGEIKNLDMAPMTMVFAVKDGVPWTALKAGDKVRFQAARLDGKLTVTALQP